MRTRYAPAGERGQSILRAPRRVRRQEYGVSPTMRWKERVKCGWSHMPHLTAIELRGSDVVSISPWALRETGRAIRKSGQNNRKGG